MIGGLAIYLVLLSAALVSEVPSTVEWVISSTTIIVIIGALDDVFCLGVRIRLVAQIGAATTLMIGSSIWIKTLGPEFGVVNNTLDYLGPPLTILAIVSLTNAYNLIDGIDGLAAGQVLVSLGTIGTVLLVTHGAIAQANWFLLFVTTVFSFWLINLSLTPIAKVFLGDAGSLLIGFVLGWTLIFYTQYASTRIHPVIALWCVTVPIYDAVTVIVRRLIHKRSPFSADRNHLHHLLVDAGVHQHMALAIILASSLILNGLGVWITLKASPIVSLGAYVVCFMIFSYGILNPTLRRHLENKLKLSTDN